MQYSVSILSFKSSAMCLYKDKAEALGKFLKVHLDNLFQRFIFKI